MILGKVIVCTRLRCIIVKCGGVCLKENEGLVIFSLFFFQDVYWLDEGRTTVAAAAEMSVGDRGDIVFGTCWRKWAGNYDTLRGQKVERRRRWHSIQWTWRRRWWWWWRRCEAEVIDYFVAVEGTRQREAAVVKEQWRRAMALFLRPSMLRSFYIMAFIFYYPSCYYVLPDK